MCVAPITPREIYRHPRIKYVYNIKPVFSKLQMYYILGLRIHAFEEIKRWRLILRSYLRVYNN